MNEENNYLKLKPVKEIFIKTKEESYDLLEIELDSGEKIKITEQHEVYTQRGWIRARELNLEDEIFEFNNGKIPFSSNSIEYWINKGFSIKEATDKISEIQKSRSPLSIQHWIKKGYAELESIELVKKEQQIRSPASINYYLNKGLSVEESKNKVSEYQSSTRDNWTDAQWENFKLTNGHSLESYIYREGELLGIKKYQERNKKLSNTWKNIFSNMTKEEIIKNRARYRSQNGMFNVTPSHNSGSGISGYYKNNLFRSLLELEAMLMLEKNNIKFRANECKNRDEPEVKIEYNSNGENYYYVPDVLVFDDQNKIIKIMEVKPIEYKNIFIEEILKKVYCNIEKQNLDFEIICSDVVEYNYKKYKKMFERNIIEIHDNKLNRFKGL